MMENGRIIAITYAPGGQTGSWQLGSPWVTKAREEALAVISRSSRQKASR